MSDEEEEVELFTSGIRKPTKMAFSAEVAEPAFRFIEIESILFYFFSYSFIYLKGWRDDSDSKLKPRNQTCWTVTE